MHFRKIITHEEHMTIKYTNISSNKHNEKYIFGYIRNKSTNYILSQKKL